MVFMVRTITRTVFFRVLPTGYFSTLLAKTSHCREYKLEVTAPLPSDFVTVCDRLGIQVDPTWTPEWTSSTANSAIPLFGADEIRGKDVVTALKGGG
ncbi:hypothetical protein FS749_007284 [Ceratobasidium sp. UAMH 11750]|nr:hypothetical protein FS749_007284 [Ceratobasidium sp. UAMH 11750]